MKHNPKTQQPPLNFREWWDEVGTENVEALAKHLVTSLAYCRLVRSGNKRMSLRRAQKVVAWATEHTPGFVPDIILLMAGVPKNEQPRPRVIAPSQAFRRSMAARKVAEEQAA